LFGQTLPGKQATFSPSVKIVFKNQTVGCFGRVNQGEWGVEVIVYLKFNHRVKRRDANTTGQENLWKMADANQGWEGKENIVRYAGKTLGPNSNMIFNIKQLGAYAQQYPRRFDIFRHFIYGNDTLGKNIRDVFGVTHIIDSSSGKINIIENPGAMPEVWESNRIYPVRDTGEALGRMASPDFTPSEVLWESKDMPNENEKIIVFNRSWYPGWKAYINGLPAKIYPVNINQQAVITPASVSPSEVTLKYDPFSYKIGFLISSATIVGLAILFLKTKSEHDKI